MNFKLRSQGKPCQRSPRGTLVAVAGAVALAMAPAAAAQGTAPPAWYAVGAEAKVPTTVDLNDVASNGSTVIAAGRDEFTGKAAIWRRAGGSWQQDLLSVPDNSTLVDVAIDGAEAWVVGHSGEGDATLPLVLKLTATGWAPAAGLPAGTRPTAVALAQGAPTIGDGAGNLYRFGADGVADGSAAIAAGAINSISLVGPDTGFAVAGWETVGPTSDTFARIYELTPDPTLVVADAAESGVDLLSVAATSAVAAAAVDSKGHTWRIANRKWQREDDLPEGAVPMEVAAKAGDNGWVYELIAGAQGGAGAIWRRKRQATADEDWTGDPLPAGTGALTGVAVDGPTDAWAVGLHGTLLRYWRKPLPPPLPPPPPAPPEDADEEETQDQQETPLRVAETQQTYYEEEPSVEPAPVEQTQPEQPVEQSRPAEEPVETVVIDDSPEAPAESTPIGRLLKKLKVLRKRRALVITFRLTSRARVAAIAKRSGKVAGRTRLRTLPKGPGKLVLRFRGAPPNSLKLIVRPVKKA